jgi:quercetin dioxygenase-like cupin family protein
MPGIFPEPIKNLPLANVPIDGVTAYLSQAEKHQMVFMEFDIDTEAPEHSHEESQWTIVLEGRNDMTINGITKTFTKGDRFFVDKGVLHSAKIYKGYADLTFFNQKDRYAAK